ncbi:MAG TPA: extracellular solute-binding protein [Anaeromyxobacteraceae bacterium]|nr:extracellular solute-binding protein [Anaeromyxobacteraceae bacterium]
MKPSRPALTLLAALALAGPAQAAELTVWHAYRAEEKAAFEKACAQYAAGKPGTTVTTLAVPYDAFADKITAAVPRGKGPDVFIFGQDRLGGWIEAGNTVEPLDFFLDEGVKGRFIPTTLQAMTYRGTVYGLPFNYKEITLIYNKKLVSAPPKTTGELVALAKKLTDKKAGRFGLAYAYSDYYYHAALQNAFGGRVFDEGKPVLNAPENVKALDLLLKWIDAGIVPAEPSTALITSLFNEGKAAMVFNGPWFLGEIAKEVDYGLARLPTVDEAGGKPMRPWMTVEGLYVTAPSKNKEAAYDLVKYLTDVPAATVMALEGRQTPSNKKAYDDPRVAGDRVLSAFRAQAETALPMPNLPEMSMVWSPATTVMNTVTRKAATPQGALDKAQAQVVKEVAGLRKRP